MSKIKYAHLSSNLAWRFHEVIQKHSYTYLRKVEKRAQV